MQAPSVGVRAGSALERFVTAAVLVATCGAALLIVRELWQAPPVIAQAVSDPTSVPGSLSERAISVPSLLLRDGRQVKVGDTLDSAERTLGAGTESRGQEQGWGVLGQRLTRQYDEQGTRFAVVFEPFQRGGGLRVAGIYLQ